MTALWAIALQTISMSARRLVTALALVCIALSSVFMLYFLEGDNTLLGLLRVMLTWSFGFMSTVTMLLVLYLGSTVLDREFVGQQITLIDVKPVSRAQLLAGKWLGLALVSAGLLVVMGAMIYGSLVWLTAKATDTAESSGAPTVRDEGRAAELDEVEARFFTMRRSFRGAAADPERQLDRRLERLVSQGRLDPEDACDPELRQRLAATAERSITTIAADGSERFRFTGVATDDLPERIAIRFKFYGRRGQQPEHHLRHAWSFAVAGSTPVRVSATSYSGVEDEIEIDARAIASDGRIELEIANAMQAEAEEPPADLLVPLPDGLELLVPSGSFTRNFIAALVLLWIRMVMLAGIGIAANTFLRGSVTAFLLFGLILAGSLNSFVGRVIAPEAHRGPPSVVRSALEDEHDREAEQEAEKETEVDEHLGHHHGGSKPRSAFAEFLKREIAPRFLEFVPDFDDTDPVPDLLVGREILWGQIGWRALVDLGARTGLMWLVGFWYFRRREVGIPTLD